MILSMFFYSLIDVQAIILKTILKFTLKQLRHVSVQSHHLQGAHYSRLIANSAPYIHQQGPTNKCSHTSTVLITQRCILMDYFNNCNFSEHKLMRSLMMV